MKTLFLVSSQFELNDLVKFLKSETKPLNFLQLLNYVCWQLTCPHSSLEFSLAEVVVDTVNVRG